MSKRKTTLCNYTSRPPVQSFSTNSLHHNLLPTYSKWDDPEYIASREALNLMREGEKLPILTASNVRPRPKRWIYTDLLQEGELTIVAGAPNSGKTTLYCALAAGITNGADHTLGFDLTPTGVGHVLVVDKEDDVVRSLVPRLQAAGADMSRVHFLGCKGQESQEFSFSNPRDIMRLEGFAKTHGDNLGLIVIDPLYCAVDGEASNNHKARQAYEQLASLAKRLSCAILGIVHTVRNPHNKSALARVAGPPALREVPRAILLLSKNANGASASGGTHVLVHAKHNEGAGEGGYEVGYVAVETSSDYGPIEAPKLIVTAKLTGSADVILNDSDSGPTIKSRGKTEAAMQFLRDTLKDGPQIKRDLVKLAKEAGIREGTLELAKDFLKITTNKRKGDGYSEWRLPDAEIEKS